MLARLPETACVKSWRTGGETPVTELVPGDVVQGYDVGGRDLLLLTISRIEPLEPQPVLSHFLQHYRWCHFFPCTEVFDVRGLTRIDHSPRMMMSYCVVNPKRLVPKIIADTMESPPTPGILLEWTGTALLWSEGVLVGTSNSSR